MDANTRVYGNLVVKCGNEPSHEERKTHVVVTTHDGRFHTDEVTGVALLLLGPLRNTKQVFIGRNRYQYWWDNSDYLLDVGNIYDPDRNRFDHHDVGFDISYQDGTYYATAGMVWLKYGESIIAHLIATHFPDFTITEEHIVAAYDQVMSLIKRIDNVDNGQSADDHYQKNPLIGLVTVLNPQRSVVMEKDQYHQHFLTAVDAVLVWLKNKITTILSCELSLPYFHECIRAYQEKEYVVFPSMIPWKDMLMTHWHDLLPFKLVISTDDDNSRWVVHGLPGHRRKFGQLRCSAPHWMRGKSGRELEEVVGISDLVFCHRNGFMCYTKTRESAEAVARYMLDIHNQCLEHDRQTKYFVGDNHAAQ